MRHIVIASHHCFASGLKDTLEFVCGDCNVESIDAYVDETPLHEQVASVFSRFGEDDEVLVLTDMLQGSVNQAFLPYMSGRVFLVTGVNVPCAIELALTAGELTPEAVRSAVDASRSQILYVNDQDVAIGEDDE